MNDGHQSISNKGHPSSQGILKLMNMAEDKGSYMGAAFMSQDIDIDSTDNLSTSQINHSMMSP